MVSWADEFDIDDSDILGALNNRRKDPSQLASPPWPLAAAGYRPPHLPLTSSSADPQHSIASSASLLKRFQRPQPMHNGPCLSQNLASITFDSQRKRKQGVDSATPQLPKAACGEGRNLDDAICRQGPSSSLPDAPRESASQVKYGHHRESQGQRVNEGDLAANGIFTVEEHCHSLSSHGKSPTPAEGEISRCYSGNAQSETRMRQEALVTSQQPLRDMQLGNRKMSSVAPDTHQSGKQNSKLDRLQQKRTCVQFSGNGGDARSKRVASISQHVHNLENRLNNVEETISEQTHLRNSIRKSVPDNPLDNGHLRGSRGVRFLPKDLHYQIPGPAGVVQQGLGQNVNSFSDNNRMRKNNPAPCRASVVDDGDFQSGAWLKAKNYLEKSSIQVSTISSVKTSRTENRVSKLLAIIKSCIPNGCGDAMVNLKDQTDSIYGIINRRVLSETEFGRVMDPGAVILLHQVAVFSPTPYAHYLNITINNVEQVFAKESQFFKGECSRAASRAAIVSSTDDELMANVNNQSSRMEDLYAQKPGENAHSKTDQLLEEEDELEILLARSAHQATQEPEQDEQEVPAKINAIGSARGFPSDSPMTDQIDELHSNFINDGYDQLLDDIGLFPCIQTRSGAP